MWVRMVRRIVFPVLFATVAILVAVAYPMLILLFAVGGFVLLVLSRQLNFYKIVAMLKRAARNLSSKLRYEIRAKLHLGFRDYSNISANADEELHHRTHGYIR